MPEPHYAGICGNSNLDSEEVDDATALLKRSPGIILSSSSKVGVVNFPIFLLSQWDFSYALVLLRFARFLQHEIDYDQFVFNSSAVFTS